MILKKNRVSNLIWIIYSIFALAFSAFVFTKASKSFGFDAGFGLLAVPVFAALGVGIVFLSELIRKKTNKAITIKPIVAKIIPYCLALALVGVGIWLRIREFSQADFELGEYFQNSIITSKPMYRTLHGATQFYYFFIRQILLVFGNHFEAAIIYQIVCQTLASITLFFAVKRLMGYLPSLTMLGFIALAPYSVNQCMQLGPSCMYLLFIAADILLISFVVPFRKFSYIISAIAGALTGVIGYMDLTSLIFIVLAIIFLCVENSLEENYKKVTETKKIKDKSKKDKIIRRIKMIINSMRPNVNKVADLQDKTVALIIFFGAWLFILFICVVVDLVATGFTFSYVVITQLAMYAPDSFSLYSIYEGIDIVSGVVMSIILLIGIPSGFRRSKTDQGSAVFIIALVLCLLSGFSMIQNDMNCGFYIVLALSVIAGESVYGITVPLKCSTENKEDIDEEQALILEAEREKERRKTVHKIEDGEMLENPLPIPVKKQRKKMEYDYFVPDDAEYDI